MRMTNVRQTMWKRIGSLSHGQKLKDLRRWKRLAMLSERESEESDRHSSLVMDMSSTELLTTDDSDIVVLDSADRTGIMRMKLENLATPNALSFKSDSDPSSQQQHHHYGHKNRHNRDHPNLSPVCKLEPN